MKIFKILARLSGIDILILFTAFLLVVFPNSFREVKLPMLLLIFLFSTKTLLNLNRTAFLIYFLGIVVTFTYLLVGFSEAKIPAESTVQVLFVYVFAPLMWIAISNYVFDRYNINQIVTSLNFFGILGCLSVFLGIWLFDIGRLDLLEYIVDNPNKSFTEEGVIEMKLFVYGSLIFIMPAYIQLNVRHNRLASYILIILLFFITAIVSGRSALLLSIFIGLFFFLLFNLNKQVFKYGIVSIIIFFVSLLILDYFGVNLSKILDDFFMKVFGGTDKERPNQIRALVDGINDNIFGAGHGVGVDYIRSYNFPWRYEVLPVALIYRVSFVGFIIYSLPFFYTVYKFFKLKVKTNIDKYMLIGSISMVLSSFTNPYLESFEFNFFYVFPFIYFIKRVNSK